MHFKNFLGVVLYCALAEIRVFKSHVWDLFDFDPNRKISFWWFYDIIFCVLNLPFAVAFFFVNCSLGLPYAVKGALDEIKKRSRA